ncbi:hypothetical protein BH09ACT1_BH09ACT1_06850 [soil metagenome]
MSSEFLSSVDRWLDKSGHAFELRIARTFRQAGATVDLSFAYTDPATGSLREGDVLAQYDWTAMERTPASIELVVECKSGRDHPWVAFHDQDNPRESSLEDWAYFAHGPFVGVTEPLTNAWMGLPPFHTQRVASHLVAAHSDDSHNPAGNAVRQVLSAAEGRRQRYVDRQAEDRKGCVIVPVIVTRARLVECQLADDGNVRLQEVPMTVVAGPRHGRKPARVFVVTEEAAPRFAQSFLDLAARANTAR